MLGRDGGEVPPGAARVRSRLVGLAVVLALGGAAYALVVHDPAPRSLVDGEPLLAPPADEPPPAEKPPPAPPPLASGRSYAEAKRQEALERAKATWEEVLRLQKEGKLAEALALARRLRKNDAAFMSDAARVAAVARIETALNAEAKQAELEKALATARLTDAQRAALSGRLAATAEVLARSANDADLDQLTRHLRRFLLPTSPGAGGDLPADALLRQFVKDRQSRRGKDTNPPVADVDAAEQRRVDQLDKLRQRDAVGLLDAIHAGLAWLALHQKEDGSLSDQATKERCDALKHAPTCHGSWDSTGDVYAVATTGLAAIAFLDFRDQDVHGWFDPYLGRAIEWLKKAQKPDGSWPGSGQQYTTAIALMALGQAAASTGSEELRERVRRGLAFFEQSQGPLGGYRYRPNDPAGDLSVTAWVAQAFEAARAAGVQPSPKLTQGLEIFLNYVWGGDAKFSYVYRQGPSQSLAPAGMLVGHIAWADKPAGVAETWKAYLKGLPVNRPPNLYTLYYGIRLSILLQGALEDPWRTWAFALSQQQVMQGTGAGSFLVPVTQSHKPGVALSTALSVLTLEHALYLR